MGNLYNAAFGMNVGVALLAPMLTDEDPRVFFPRFRDCYEEGGRIVVYTRVGGGNRTYDPKPPHGCMYDEGDWQMEYSFGEDKLYRMPTFAETYDDDFDPTYGYYVFDVPEEWKDDFDKIMSNRVPEVSDAFVERVAKCFGVDAGTICMTLADAEIEGISDAPDWESLLGGLRG